jgi:hypothetical protein
MDRLGKVIDTYTLPDCTQYTVVLSKPVPAYQPAEAPECCFVDGRLWACTKRDWEHKPKSQPISVRFAEKPKTSWIGYGRLAKKAVESIMILVYDDQNWDLFVRLAQVGFAYEGAK